MHFIVKLFPEIIIKSAPVRKRMVKQLSNNLAKLLAPVSSQIQVVRFWDKIEVSAPDDGLMEKRVRDVLAHTPGIASFLRVRCFPLRDFDDIYQKTLAIWSEHLAGKTFCVRVKRTGNHDFTSNDIEKYVGGGLNQHTSAAGVKLKNPEVTVRLEIKDQQLFVIENTEPGLGGFPLGTQDAVLSLISGGFDSSVASYLSIKRGLRTHFLFFNLGGRAHEIGVREMAHYLWRKFGASHRVQFISVPFEEVVAEILEKVHNSQMGVVLKRMMLRVAARVAEDCGVQAVVTGESVAQVSSQTLANLAIIDAVTDTLVLRPLITADKSDIINTARAIGTEAFAANMPEYCGVISVKPTTRARIERINAEEQRFDFAVLDRAFASRRQQNIEEVMEQADQQIKVEVLSVPLTDAVIIDIRHPDEEELSPLQVDGVSVEKIPFYQLGKRMGQLNPNTRYMLYCAKGVMSRLHAELLHEQGHTNVLVYKPR